MTLQASFDISSLLEIELFGKYTDPFAGHIIQEFLK